LRGYLAPAGGARRRQGRATGQPARRGRAGPLHLIHGGALPDSGRPERLCWHRRGTPATAGMRHRDGPRSWPSTARSLTGGGTRWLTGRRVTFQRVAEVTQAGQWPAAAL